MGVELWDWSKAPKGGDWSKSISGEHSDAKKEFWAAPQDAPEPDAGKAKRPKGCLASFSNIRILDCPEGGFVEPARMPNLFDKPVRGTREKIQL